MVLQGINLKIKKDNNCFPNRFAYKKISIISPLTNLFLVFFLYASQFSIAEQEIPIEKIKGLIANVRVSENTIRNVFVESEIWQDKKQIRSEEWERTGSYAKSLAWINGLPKSKIRVDVLKDITEPAENNKPFLEAKYSVGFDGMYGRRVWYSRQIGEEVTNINKGEVTVDYPQELLSPKIQCLTGEKFNSYYFFSNNSKVTKFSEFLEQITTEDAIAAKAFKFTREEFLGTECIKISSVQEPTVGRVSYWLDSSKGLALRGYELVNLLKDGREWKISSIQVTKLEEVTDGIWFPTEAFFETSPPEDNSPYSSYQRTFFHVLNMKINSPDFKDSNYEVPFPQGFSIHNEVTGKKYFAK